MTLRAAGTFFTLKEKLMHAHYAYFTPISYVNTRNSLPHIIEDLLLTNHLDEEPIIIFIE